MGLTISTIFIERERQEIHNHLRAVRIVSNPVIEFVGNDYRVLKRISAAIAPLGVSYWNEVVNLGAAFVIRRRSIWIVKRS